MLLEGDTLALTELLGDRLELGLRDGDTELLGDREAEGLRLDEGLTPAPPPAPNIAM